VAISSEDDWATAEVIARTPTEGSATTLALRYADEGEAPSVYYINAYLGEMDRTEYQIVRAPLDIGATMGE
jgi:hypothetical protein